MELFVEPSGKLFTFYGELFPDITGDIVIRGTLQDVANLGCAEAKDKKAAEPHFRSAQVMLQEHGNKPGMSSEKKALSACRRFPSSCYAEVAALIDDLDLELVSVTQIQPS